MTAAGLLILAWAVAAALFSLVIWVRLLRLPSGQESGGSERLPPVLLLRPIDAPTPCELTTLAAPIDYPGAVEHVVLSPYRPRLPPGVRWLYSDPLCCNRKAGHLAYALSVLPVGERVVLSVDADVAVDGALVRSLVSPLLAGAGLSCAAWLPLRGRGLAARAMRGLLAHSHHSFLALHVMSAGEKAISGKALGLSTGAQQELCLLADHIGEDLALSRRLFVRGERVELARAPARVPQAAGVPLSEVVARIARWMRVLRAHRPALYPTVPVLFCPSPLLLALALGSGSMPALGAVGLLFLTRTLLSVQLTALRPGELRGLEALDWLWGEALLTAAFGRSLFGSKVTWRGRAFALRAGGRMERLPLGEG